MNAFSKLSLREKALILSLLPMVVFITGYQFIWSPLQVAQEAARSDITSFRLVYNTAALAQRGGAPKPKAEDSMPLPTRITSSATERGLNLRRIEPEGQGSRVTLDDTSFSAILTWLADLEGLHNISTRAIQIDRRPEPGIVSTRVFLERLP